MADCGRGDSEIFIYSCHIRSSFRQIRKESYMEESNDGKKKLGEMHRMVEIVKKDPEMSIRYWRFLEELNKSKKEGEREGYANGEAAGDLQRLIFQVCKKMKKKKPLEEIAEDLEEEVSVIEPIYNAAKDFAPEYDPKAIFERLNTSE